MATLVPTFDLARTLGETLEVEAATVGELLDLCAERYGPTFTENIKGVAIVVDGRSISALKGRGTRLGPDSSVWLVRASAGG